MAQGKSESLPLGVRFKQYVTFQLPNGEIVKLPQYEKNGYPMPVEHEYDCMFFDRETRTCQRDGMFIVGLGCWGAKCKFRNVPVGEKKDAKRFTGSDSEAEDNDEGVPDA